MMTTEAGPGHDDEAAAERSDRGEPGDTSPVELRAWPRALGRALPATTGAITAAEAERLGDYNLYNG
jgi:hypothetical protein